MHKLDEQVDLWLVLYLTYRALMNCLPFAHELILLDLHTHAFIIHQFLSNLYKEVDCI